ncbi:AAA family ATPase [Chitinophaga pollutisoli]|uniref:AAA family ATPase n=1 Tax=Chitinophaga pollutisoli TaxID=3133966 RepID=A0ABZ2YRR1_9BACT
MPIHSQVLKKINIDQLKGLRNVEIGFDGNNLTAIMGLNGVGKSTVLHALACVYRPPMNIPGLINYQFQIFFTPTSHSIWAGSNFSITHSYSDGPTAHPNVQTHFRKAVDRWVPKKERRPERAVTFIGMRSAVPEIEKETKKTRIAFNAARVPIAHEVEIRRYAGVIMNRQYQALHTSNAYGKNYITLQHNNVEYSSLFMGAGEQRIIYILSEILKAPNSSLVLIEEIDVLMHQDALVKLLEIIDRIARRKNLQVVFTTHAHSILDLPFINYRHLLQTNTNTLCFNETKPDALHRLTGRHLRPLEIFIEDDLAEAIANKVAAGLKMSRFIETTKFGAATNCFTAVAATYLRRTDNKDKMLFVLDGDEYRTDEEKITRIGKALTGTTDENDQQRAEALVKITQFDIPPNRKPEHYYHGLICALDDRNLSDEELEWVSAAREIEHVEDGHLYFNEIIERMGVSRENGLTRLVDILRKCPEWAQIVQPVHDWLDGKRPELEEH